MDTLAEFYVACNPPLQPCGVVEVYDKLAQSKQAEAVIEILYEPDALWFKIIANKQDQKPVTDCIQDTLLEILEADCDLRRPQHQAVQEDDIIDDVDVGDNARVLPWIMLQNIAYGDAYRRELQDEQFPHHFRSFSCKEVWSKFEDDNNWDLDRLFMELEAWSDIGAPRCSQSLQDLIHCDVSFNIRPTRLYLASNDSFQHITFAVRKLDGLFHIAKSESLRIEHLAFTEGSEPSMCSLRYLSHLGLSASTYYHQFNGIMDEEAVMMKSATTIRACQKDEAGHWVSETSRYPRKPALQAEAAEKFNIFAQYKYRYKEAQRSAQSSHRRSEHGNFTLTRGTAVPRGGWATSRPSPREVCRDLGDLISFDEPALSMALTSANSVTTSSLQTLKFGHSESDLDLLTTDNVEEISGLQEPLGSGSTQSKVRQRNKRRTFYPELETILERQTTRLRCAPGHVTVKIRMGRFALMNLVASEVDNGSGPYRRLDALLASLKQGGTANLRFSTILSTLGRDAEKIANLRSNGDLACVVTGVKVEYEIKCLKKQEKENELFFVIVDADDFAVRCIGPEVQVAATYIHCIRRAWDLQGYMERRAKLSSCQDLNEFADAVRASLHVSRDKNGNPVLDMLASNNVGLSIEAVQIRHMAKFRHKDAKNAHLCIEMKQDLCPGDVLFGRRKWTKAGQRDNACPSLWYEAYVASDVAQSFFTQNLNLEIGDVAAWTCEALREAGVFSDMCQIALGMVKQLDDVGMRNDSGLENRVESRLQFSNAVQETEQRHTKYEFW